MATANATTNTTANATVTAKATAKRRDSSSLSGDQEQHGSMEARDTVGMGKRRGQSGWKAQQQRLLFPPQNKRSKPNPGEKMPLPRFQTKLDFDRNADCSELASFRALLDGWNKMGCLSHPRFALELCSLFLRCLNSTLNRARSPQGPAKEVIRPDLIGIMAALA